MEGADRSPVSGLASVCLLGSKYLTGMSYSLKNVLPVRFGPKKAFQGGVQLIIWGHSTIRILKVPKPVNTTEQHMHILVMPDNDPGLKR